MNSEHHEDEEGMADRSQRQIGKQDERTEARDTADVEIFVVESSNAAVQEEVVVVSSNDASFAHCTVESPRRDVFAAARAAISIASLGLVI
jgi:hypothetical protein